MTRVLHVLLNTPTEETLQMWALFLTLDFSETISELAKRSTNVTLTSNKTCAENPEIRMTRVMYFIVNYYVKGHVENILMMLVLKSI